MRPLPYRPVRVLYIGGYGRSGSTLLDRALGETPGVVSLGEVRHVWREGLVENRRCGCGEPFQDCAYWRSVLQLAFGTGRPDVARLRAAQLEVDRWWRVPLLARTPESAALREYADVLSRLYRAVARVTGADVLVDSSKDVSHGYVLRHLRRDIDVRIVHLVRDPRAVAYSWLRHKDNPGAGRPMDRRPAWRTALEWDVINAGVGALRGCGRPYLKVRYEDLTAEPAATVRRVLEFAGVDPTRSPVGPDGSVQLTRSHTAAGNPDRFRSGPTRIAGDAEWRQQMRLRDRLAVSALCAVPLARAGRAQRAARPMRVARAGTRLASVLLICLGAVAMLTLGSAHFAATGGAYRLVSGPFAGRTLYAPSPGAPASASDAVLQRLAATPQATWLTGGSATGAARQVRAIAGAAAAHGQVASFVVYDIPHRDCGGYSSGGARDASGYRGYVKAIAGALHRTRAFVVLEPDSLAGIDCLAGPDRRARFGLLKWATATLSRPGVAVYLDGGHARWQPARTMARRLIDAGVARARGFALNVSNFDSTQNEVQYGRRISARVGWKRFVIDTSRNGGAHPAQWCNPPGVALGPAPGTPPPDPLADALLWIKRPGESDGTCGTSPAPAGRFEPGLAVTLAHRAGW